VTERAFAEQLELTSEDVKLIEEVNAVSTGSLTAK